MTPVQIVQGDVVTTDGSIAVLNLHAQIEGITTTINRLLAAEELPQLDETLFVARVGVLIDLLGLRGHVSGRIEDYERACELGNLLVERTPKNGMALMARARSRATLHRFADALSDLDVAAQTAVNKREVSSARVGILQSLGRYKEAETLAHNMGVQDDASVTGHLAVILAECSQPAEADHLFKGLRLRYRGISPFPLAQIDFHRGVMWHREGDLHTAQACYEDALRLIPQYVPALGHLAEVEIHLGKHQAAAARLRPLANISDDPEYAATLATALRFCNELSEAHTWRQRAATRYHALVARHPEAYAHHAAEFWLSEGANSEKGLQLALQNLEFSDTPRSRKLVAKAQNAAQRFKCVCEVAK